MATITYIKCSTGSQYYLSSIDDAAQRSDEYGIMPKAISKPLQPEGVMLNTGSSKPPFRARTIHYADERPLAGEMSIICTDEEHRHVAVAIDV